MTKSLAALSLAGLATLSMLSLLPQCAKAASFDCDAQGLSADEKAICDSRELNDLDVKMATQFDWLSGMFAMGARGDLEDQQSKWLKARQACGPDRDCIKKAYEARLKKFDEDYNTFERPAPMSR